MGPSILPVGAADAIPLLREAAEAEVGAVAVAGLDVGIGEEVESVGAADLLFVLAEALDVGLGEGAGVGEGAGAFD